MKNREKTILISRIDNIGDVVLTLPLCVLIKKEWPNCRIVFLARAYVRDVLAFAPYIDSFLDWQDLSLLSDTEIVFKLKSYSIDTAIHVYSNLRITFLCYKARIICRIGSFSRWYHFIFCNKFLYIRRKKSKLHESQLNLRFLHSLGLKKNYSLSELNNLSLLRKPDFAKVKLPSGWHQKKFKVVIHPGSNGHAWEWDERYFIELIKECFSRGFQVFVTGTVLEKKRFKRLQLQCVGKMTNLMGQQSLKELISLLAYSDVVVASSTGPLHLASALGSCCVGIYPRHSQIGPQRWGPLGQNVQLVLGDPPQKKGIKFLEGPEVFEILKEIEVLN